MEPKNKINIKEHLITGIISFVIGIIIFLITFFSGTRCLMDAINGLSYSAIALICVGGLMFVSREGFFDFASYGFKQMGSSMFGRKGNECNDFAGYKEQNALKRKNKPMLFITVIIVGVFYLILSFVIRAF